jgi:hypothetical protein
VSRLSGAFARTMVFLLLVVPCLNISLGLNYTPLRFMLPVASLVALHGLASAASGRGGGKTFAILIGAFLAPLVNFAFSPEMGLAAWLACMAYFIALWRTPLRRLTIGLAAAAAALPATAAVFSRSYFDSILSISGGGLNFPIFPTAHVVLFLVAVFCLIPVLAVIAVETRDARGAIAAGLCVVTGLLIVPALGRCDPGHILWNGLGIFLILFAALSRAKRTAFKLFALCYIGAFGILGFRNMWKNYGPYIGEVVAHYERYSTNCPTASNGLLHYSKMMPIPPEFNALLQFEKIGTPMSVHEPLERFLKLHGKFVPDHRLCPCSDLYTPKHLEQKLADMRSMEYIVVSADSQNLLSQPDPDAVAKADSAALSDMLTFPVRLRPPKRVSNPFCEIVSAMSGRYWIITNITDEYLLLRRKPDP